MVREARHYLPSVVLAEHIRKVSMTDDQLSYIEAFCTKIRDGLDQADFNSRRQILEFLDTRGKIAFEKGEKVIYLKCLIYPKEQHQFSRVTISSNL